jgi:hypothetical protein
MKPAAVMDAEFETMADRLLAEAPYVGDASFRRLVAERSVSRLSELRGTSDLATSYRFRDGSELILAESLLDQPPDDIPYVDDAPDFADFLAA